MRSYDSMSLRAGDMEVSPPESLAWGWYKANQASVGSSIRSTKAIMEITPRCSVPMQSKGAQHSGWLAYNIDAN